jgi:hypothetical protein
MRRHLSNTALFTILALTLSLSFSGASIAGPREDQLAQYASLAKTANPAFSGFSAERGKFLHHQTFTGGKPDTATCTSCHGKAPRAAGRTLFRRNCNEVIGRECSAQEKGDWLSFMISQ